jgi:hypothetical protein
MDCIQALPACNPPSTRDVQELWIHEAQDPFPMLSIGENRVEAQAVIGNGG